MRLLVCGGRDFRDRAALHEVLDALHKTRPVTTLIEGDARGADRLAGFWARKHRIDNRKFPANWGLYGNTAGPIRNRQMLDEGQPDLVVAFPGGRGTADMIRQARAVGLTVIEVH